MQPTDPDHQRGANGHADHADAETFRLEPLDFPPPPRRSLLSKGWRVMTGRPARATAGEIPAGRPMPAWLPSVVVTIGLAVMSGLLWFGSWRAGVERDLRDVATINSLRLEVAYLRGRVVAAEQTDTYVQMLTAYEIKLREQLLPLANRYDITFPPFPERPRRRPARPDLGQPDPEENEP